MTSLFIFMSRSWTNDFRISIEPPPPPLSFSERLGDERLCIFGHLYIIHYLLPVKKKLSLQDCLEILKRHFRTSRKSGSKYLFGTTRIMTYVASSNSQLHIIVLLVMRVSNLISDWVMSIWLYVCYHNSCPFLKCEFVPVYNMYYNTKR